MISIVDLDGVQVFFVYVILGVNKIYPFFNRAYILSATNEYVKLNIIYRYHRREKSGAGA